MWVEFGQPHRDGDREIWVAQSHPGNCSNRWTVTLHGCCSPYLASCWRLDSALVAPFRVLSDPLLCTVGMIVYLPWLGGCGPRAAPAMACCGRPFRFLPTLLSFCKSSSPRAYQHPWVVVLFVTAAGVGAGSGVVGGGDSREKRLSASSLPRRLSDEAGAGVGGRGSPSSEFDTTPRRRLLSALRLDAEITPRDFAAGPATARDRTLRSCGLPFSLLLALGCPCLDFKPVQPCPYTCCGVWKQFTMLCPGWHGEGCSAVCTAVRCTLR